MNSTGTGSRNSKRSGVFRISLWLALFVCALGLFALVQKQLFRQSIFEPLPNGIQTAVAHFGLISLQQLDVGRLVPLPVQVLAQARSRREAINDEDSVRQSEEYYRYLLAGLVFLILLFVTLPYLVGKYEKWKINFKRRARRREEETRAKLKPQGTGDFTLDTRKSADDLSVHKQEEAGIRLRRIRAEDEHKIRSWRNDPEVTAFMFTDNTIPDIEHLEWSQQELLTERSHYWIIVAEGLDVGVAGIRSINREHRRAYTTLYIAGEEHRGRGIGRAVQYQLLKYLFEELHCHKACCEVLASNEAALHMLESLGFQKEGVLRDHIIKGGKPMDVIPLSLLTEEWSLRKYEEYHEHSSPR